MEVSPADSPMKDYLLTLMAKCDLKQKIFPYPPGCVLKLTSKPEYDNYAKLATYLKDSLGLIWEDQYLINIEQFPKIYSEYINLENEEISSEIGKSRRQIAMEMDTIFPFSCCSEISFKLGQWSYDKNADEKKKKRKMMIDENTTSKDYYFRRSKHKIYDEETGDITSEGVREYEIAHYEYDFTLDCVQYESNIPLLESMLPTQESRELIIAKLEGISDFLETLPFKFRGLNVSIITSIKNYFFECKLIDLEYMYPDSHDSTVQKGCESLIKLVQSLS
ncbi:unnamed protein product [Moneuplotes crassus]|uniref:Uncharacterized protein n=1 Tax=Euplotes crassus TaxID=5936 RepID=A0AAD2CYX2_EUPCR|nr:unnamed protein product [Moneuplotes crassus]